MSINTGLQQASSTAARDICTGSNLAMGSFARAARFLVLLQIALFVLSAVIMSGSGVCVGASAAGALDPSRLHGEPYTRPCTRADGCRTGGVPYTRPCTRADGCHDQP